MNSFPFNFSIRYKIPNTIVLILFSSFSAWAQVNEKEEWIKLGSVHDYVMGGYGYNWMTTSCDPPYGVFFKGGSIIQNSSGGVTLTDISISRDGKRFLIRMKNTRLDTSDMKNYFYCPDYNDSFVAPDWRKYVSRKVKNDSLFILRYFYYPIPPNSITLYPIIKFSGDIDKRWNELNVNLTYTMTITVPAKPQPKPKMPIVHVDTLKVIDLIQFENFTIEGSVNENAYYETPVGYLRINKEALKHCDKSNFAFADSTLFDKNKNLWYFKLPTNYSSNDFSITLPILNNGTDTLKLLLENEQPYDTMEFPHILAPGQKGWIEIHFDLTYFYERGKYQQALSLVTKSGKIFQMNYILTR